VFLSQLEGEGEEAGEEVEVLVAVEVVRSKAEVGQPRRLGSKLAPKVPGADAAAQVAGQESAVSGEQPSLPSNQRRDLLGPAEGPFADKGQVKTDTQARQPTRPFGRVGGRRPDRHQAGATQDAVPEGALDPGIHPGRQAEVIPVDDQPS
jgi:hypothetical protein